MPGKDTHPLNKLPDFLYCTNSTELPESPLILHTGDPRILGKIVYYDSFEEMAYALANEMTITYAIVPGYNIAVVFVGVLKDNKLPAIGGELFKLVENIVTRMADFFYDQRINPFPSGYKKYLQAKPTTKPD